MKWIAIVFALFITFVIYLENNRIPNVFHDIIRSVPHGDKIGHFVVMGSLAFITNLAIGDRNFCRWKDRPMCCAGWNYDRDRAGDLGGI